MKNIAIPLLMASSAQAQRTKEQRMAQDRAVPKPILIADGWHDGSCVDAGSEVSTAYAALVAAEGKLAEATGLRAALVEAVDEAQTAKNEATLAVVEQDVAMRVSMETADAADVTEMAKMTARDQAALAETAQIAATEAALAAKEAADEALSAAQETKEAMDTALIAAEAHEDHEQEQTASWEGKVNGQEATYNTAEGQISGLEGLYDDEVDLYDPLQATTDEKKALWDDYLSLTAKLTTEYTTSEEPIFPGTVGTLAEILAGANTTLTNTELANLNGKKDLWVVKSKDAVRQMYLWINFTEAWTDYGTNQVCTGDTVVDKSADATDETTCKAVCTALLAWPGTDALPTGAAYTTLYDAANPTGCTAVDWKSDGSVCGIYSVAPVTGAAGAANDAADTTCSARDKVTQGGTTTAANLAVAVSVTEYTNMISDLALWATQSQVVDEAQEAVDLATEYNTKINAEKSSAEGTRNGHEGDYNSAYALSEAKKEEVDTAKTNWDNKVSETATALSTLNSYKASLATQEAEEAAQDALVELAEADVAAQAETVESLESAAETAANEYGDAEEDQTEATEAKETAEEEYEAAVEAAEESAEALVTPLSELAGLRETAVEATEALVEALDNESDQEAAIGAESELVDEASEAHLAALVACRAARFDQYAAALAGEEQARQDKLDEIEDLIDANPPKAAGTLGARCEKAVSNGTFRPKRNEATCTGETVCCGASKIAVGNLIMTVETCQNDTETSYSYVPPRGPMATAFPTAQSVPFQCIDGAQKLAAAASALAAAVYMLA